MILVFGGTTEGKIVAKMLDTLGEDYLYSTKTKVNQGIKGELLFGAMEETEIVNFCKSNLIKLIINASHPFAINLHQNIFKASQRISVRVVRYSRYFSGIQEGGGLRVFATLKEMNIALLESEYENPLFLTGVQTIPYFKQLWQQRECYFRILSSELSYQKASEFGLPDNNIIRAEPSGDINEIVQLALRYNSKIILTKESGETGYFKEKQEAARLLNIPLWIVKRPELPSFDIEVDSKKELLKAIYLQRKESLKTEGKLRMGYTTGTCVLAAAKACFYAIIEKEFPDKVEISLPDGGKTEFYIFSKEFTENSASCIVVKDAGDDPDITHAKEIGCKLLAKSGLGIHFEKGIGIGEVTLPGLKVDVGEPAINPQPREMIRDLLEALIDEYELNGGFVVKPFVPEGESLAKLTFNPRIGVVGGISILGTTGRVYPFSNEAFVATIKNQMAVAKESGCSEIVLTSGKRSEKIVAKHFVNLPEHAFIHFGNQIGVAIELAIEKGIKKINLAIMFGKGIKLADGHLNTHSKKVVFNPEFAARIAKQSGYSEQIQVGIKEMKLANAILSIIPFSDKELFYKIIASKCLNTCKSIIVGEVIFRLFLISEQGEVIISEE